MQEVELNWERSLKVWWSLVWRGVLFGFIAGFIAGFIVGFLGFPNLGGLAGLVVGIPIGMWVVKLVLAKSFSDFRIALVSLET